MNYREYYKKEKQRETRIIIIQGFLLSIVVIAAFYGSIWVIATLGQA